MSHLSSEKACLSQSIVCFIPSHALRPGLSVEEARDILCTLNSRAVYDLLVEERQWSADRYRDWIAFILKPLLLPDDSRPERARQDPPRRA